MNTHGQLALWIACFGSVVGAVLLHAREDDAQLFARIANGDSRALGVLYGKLSDRVMAVAFRLLRDPYEAEDVVQDTFVEVWKRAPQYERARGGAAAWVLTIARNRAIDRLRAQGSSSRAARAASSEPPSLVVPEPLELARRRQAHERVSAALASLPLEQRQVIELSYLDGLTQSEIAARLCKPLGTVKSRIRAGMSKLTEILVDGVEGGAA